MRERLRVFVNGSAKDTKLIEKRLNTMWGRLERIHGLQIEKMVEPLADLMKRAPAGSEYLKKLVKNVGAANLGLTRVLDVVANDAADLVSAGSSWRRKREWASSAAPPQKCWSRRGERSSRWSGPG